MRPYKLTRHFERDAVNIKVNFKVFLTYVKQSIVNENGNEFVASMKISHRIADEGEAQPVWRKSLLSPVQLIWLHV
jgi:hypothetical protein